MDRNRARGHEAYSADVALRKESVDRNDIAELTAHLPLVALRKESVDRNLRWLTLARPFRGRSPQGERG